MTATPNDAMPRTRSSTFSSSFGTRGLVLLTPRRVQVLAPTTSQATEDAVTLVVPSKYLVRVWHKVCSLDGVWAAASSLTLPFD